MEKRIVVAGAGAAGYFAAIACAEAAPAAEVHLLEKASEILAKVRISGGGRCNVTHSCFEPRELSKRYPRGGKALIGPFNRFQPRDTIEWFQSRGVTLKTEPDGRMFPTTDSSATIIECLSREAAKAGVQLRRKLGLESARRTEPGRWVLQLSDQSVLECDCLMIATGGLRGGAITEILTLLGHRLVPPVPSLFTFHVEQTWPRELPGVAVPDALAKVSGTSLKERGPILLTHSGLSGPAILRLSAWGARILHEREYRFEVETSWLPDWNEEKLRQYFAIQREENPGRQVANYPVANLPARLWEALVAEAGIAKETRWAILPRAGANALIEFLLRTKLSVVGKSMNKEEFVTAGGVDLKEVNFQTMESRICPGLYFAGEVLDIDGITGGFNFQAAWTTGWIGGNAMAEVVR